MREMEEIKSNAGTSATTTVMRTQPALTYLFGTYDLSTICIG